ncbi:MAG: energy transducer TonB [Bacteroidales bacterium]|nr:energy transducer TonB [Bacteroidales bacterium]
MKPKKSKKANLEKWKSTFFLTGLTITLATLLFAFETKSKNVRAVIFEDGFTIFEDTYVENTRREEVKAQPKPQVLTNTFTLVDNNKKIVIPDFVLPEDWNPGDGFEMINDPEEAVIDDYIPYPSINAEFPGNVHEYLARNTKYPEMARQMDMQGIVYLKFRVNSDGSIGNIEIQRGVHPLLDDEAIRVVRSMPKWKPAIQGDRKVSTDVSISIKFILKN